MWRQSWKRRRHSSSTRQTSSRLQRRPCRASRSRVSRRCGSRSPGRPYRRLSCWLKPQQRQPRTLAPSGLGSLSGQVRPKRLRRRYGRRRSQKRSDQRRVRQQQRPSATSRPRREQPCRQPRPPPQSRRRRHHRQRHLLVPDRDLQQLHRLSRGTPSCRHAPAVLYRQAFGSGSRIRPRSRDRSRQRPRHARRPASRQPPEDRRRLPRHGRSRVVHDRSHRSPSALRCPRRARAISPRRDRRRRRCVTRRTMGGRDRVADGCGVDTPRVRRPQQRLLPHRPLRGRSRLRKA